MQNDCGIEFTKWVREQNPNMPILLQSTDTGHKITIKNINASFLHKDSPKLLQNLRDYIIKNFGFGSFEFQTPGGNIIATCNSIYELKKTINFAPAKSLKYHANKNHFSNWLAARGELELASKIRPLSISDFDNTQSLRIF